MAAARASTPAGGAGAPAGAMRTTGELAARLRQPAAGAEAAAAVEHDPQRQALGRRIDVARQELGIVGECRPAADGDGVELRPPGVHERPALGRGDPAALARARGDAAVEGRGQLEQHEGAAAHHVRAEGGVLPAGTRLERTPGELDLHAGGAQPLQAAAVDLGIGIGDGADDARDARGHQRVGAGRLAAVVAAGLE